MLLTNAFLILKTKGQRMDDKEEKTLRAYSLLKYLLKLNQSNENKQLSLKPNAIIDWQTYEQALEQLHNQKIGVALDLLDEAIKKVE